MWQGLSEERVVLKGFSCVVVFICSDGDNVLEYVCAWSMLSAKLQDVFLTRRFNMLYFINLVIAQIDTIY